jgi:hypothetical protein
MKGEVYPSEVKSYEFIIIIKFFSSGSSKYNPHSHFNVALGLLPVVTRQLPGCITYAAQGTTGVVHRHM